MSSLKIKIPIITKLLNKRARNRLRVINKGYRQLKIESRLDFLMGLRNTLSRTRLGKSDSLIALSGRVNFDVDLSVRQYLTSYILGLLFNKSVLYSIGSKKPLSYPLPRQWRDALSNQGIKVNNFRSALLWRAYGFLFFARGVSRGLQGVYFLLTGSSNLKRHVCFDNIDRKCFSQSSNQHNIVNWYLQWKGKIKEIDSICHGVNGKGDFQIGTVSVTQTDGLPKLKGIKLFQYVTFAVYASIYSFIRLPFSPIYSFFLEELLKLKRVSLATDKDLAKDYLFHNSTPFYCPIWTYSVEERGSRVILYFYSANIENFKVGGNHSVQHPWHLLTWPHYLVWDECQADFVKRFAQGSPVIECVGPIWFSSFGINVDVALNSIAVFDVTPNRAARYIHLGADSEYYTPNIVNQFLNDIQEALMQNNYIMVHKMKRTNVYAHKKYNHNIQVLKEKSNCRQAHPDSDATQLIQKTVATISMPFTSTAIIAKQEGKPSVYYDPSGMVQKDDGAAHDIPILSGIDELKEWVEILVMIKSSNFT
jgi:polysaccharide biosynthesis PFTS motif protein